MTIDTITIGKDELYNLIREAIRDELQDIEDISNEEQIEIEKLYGKMPEDKPINLDKCIEL